MTVALCLRCGALKHGVFNSCDHCGTWLIADGGDDRDLAHALAFSSHYISEEQLARAGEALKKGRTIPQLPPALEAELLALVRTPQFRSMIGLPEPQGTGADRRGTPGGTGEGALPRDLSDRDMEAVRLAEAARNRMALGGL